MTASLEVEPPLRFAIPLGAEAREPAERRGLARDEVRLLVARMGTLEHVRFRDLADHLDPGDLVVVNTSATLPAALRGQRRNGSRVPVHFATELDDGSWVVEVRRPDNDGPATDVSPGEWIDLAAGVRLHVDSSYPRSHTPASRLWRARPDPTVALRGFLHDHGKPIRYGYVRGPWPLADMQTVYADEPGSAEMPSAGRPFSHRVIARLVARGVTMAPIVLHTGVSSPEKHEPPMPERFRVPAATARLLNSTRKAGNRVVAVGTTVVRALETVALGDGSVSPGSGWTELVLGPNRPVRAVNGLITGLHEPEASHLLLLEAVAGRRLVNQAYEAAVRECYLWHEFGDSMLFLPPVSG